MLPDSMRVGILQMMKNQGFESWAGMGRAGCCAESAAANTVRDKQSQVLMEISADESDN
jgi:hypothetical protein